MISLYFLIFSNLFYLLTLSSACIPNANTIEDSVKVEFVTNRRKITVEGWRNESWTGKEYFSFRSIPYAEPPIGALRFKDPQPLRELPSYIDARYEGHDCTAFMSRNGSEDCLKLSIYTPKIFEKIHPASYKTESVGLPVVVFIHAGGLYLGNGLSSNVAPDYLLSKGINHRLNTMGFLQLGTREIPGNAGFKDQVLALRWVKNYIKYFGGNPDDITLMGFSAGSLAISLHLVSPMSQGLFHKAIIMSGSVPAQIPIPRYAQLELLRRQARVLNCTGVENEQEILDCVQRFSGNEIAQTLLYMFEFPVGNPVYIYKPIVERDFGQERFLIEDPYESMQRGAFAKVPILIGFNNGERCGAAVDLYKDPERARQFYENYDELAPMLFLYDDFKGNISEATQALNEHYLPNFSRLNEDNLARVCDIFSDSAIRLGAQRLAELAAPHTKVFPYRFDYRGEFSFNRFPVKPERVEHMDDSMYLFATVSDSFKLSEANSAMIRLYTKFVFDFVKQGHRSNLPTYPSGYTRVYRSLEALPGTALAMDTYNVWKRAFLEF